MVSMSLGRIAATSTTKRRIPKSRLALLLSLLIKWKASWMALYFAQRGDARAMMDMTLRLAKNSHRRRLDGCVTGTTQPVLSSGKSRNLMAASQRFWYGDEECHSVGKRRRPQTQGRTAVSCEAPFHTDAIVTSAAASATAASPLLLLLSNRSTTRCGLTFNPQNRCGIAFSRRYFWRGGGGTDWGKHLLNKKSNFGIPTSKIATTDVSKNFDHAKVMFAGADANGNGGPTSGSYAVSVCAVQGFRPHMQDYFVVHNDFCACFDGHGGNSVARYLRMNLYANLQAALPMVLNTRPIVPAEDMTQHQTGAAITTLSQQQSSSSNSTNTTATETIAAVSQKSTPGDHASPQGLETMGQPRTAASDAALSNTSTTPLSSSSTPLVPTVDDYEAALELALEKVDREVLKIIHWSFQGSTAVACWFHRCEQQVPDDEGTTQSATNTGGSAGTSTTTTPPVDSEVERTTNEPASDSVQSSMPESDVSSAAATATTASANANAPKSTTTRTVTTLITANIGDSRAVLCRKGKHLDLTRDHKPGDPFENDRIHSVGGIVNWSGQIDRHQQPIQGTGEFRIGKSLSLSRAIGDRAERPIVSGEPELSVVQLVDDDEFVVLASDGLWDVMTSSDAVAYIRALLENAADDNVAMERDSIAALLVEEALRRGSSDNITVLIVWMQTPCSKRPKKYWI